MDTYLFIRTKRTNEGSSDDVDRFIDAFVRYHVAPDMLLLGRDQLTWDDGVVLRFGCGFALDAVCAPLIKELAAFRAWAIVRPQSELRDFIEDPRPGPMSEINWVVKDKPISMLFLLSKDGEEHLLGRHVEDIGKSLKKAITYKVFSFDGGAILFISATETCNLSLQRCARTLAKFNHWAAVDQEGETSSDFRAGPVWWWTGADDETENG